MFLLKFSILGVQILINHFLRFTFYLPCFAFLACIILTILKDNEKATRTHCNVTNYLPSISAAIAGYEPQRFIWRFSFALDSTPRYIIGYLLLQRLLNRHHISFPKLYRWIQILNSSIHFLELTFLLLLTYISSNEKKWLHESGFFGFIICSLIHMLTTILIDFYWPRTKSDCVSEKDKYFRSKRFRWFICNIVCLFCSLCFFVRHNQYCEPYVYTMFCFFEYFVILTNIAYHSIIRDEWDQQAGVLQFFY